MSYLKPSTILRKRYCIVGLIGAGGMGAVYLADDNRLKGRQCAIKEQILDSGLAQVSQTQFQQEASILAQLDHPGLPKVSDYFSDEQGGRDYLVMDYVPGQNLEQLVQQAQREGKFLNEEKVLGWIDQLCNILIYLHAQQPMVLHRDIKPANIKVTPDNRLKLVDFGLAKPFDPSDPRTVTGLQGLGSLPYTPLEQYVGYLGHTDTRTDLYALGATCYHLLTGQPPSGAHARFLNPESYINPQVLNPAISNKLNQAILWAMQLHPNDRAESLEVWYTALSDPLFHEKITPKTDSKKTTQLMTSTNIVKLPSISFTPITKFLQENILLFSVAIILLLLALVMTFG